MTRGERRARTDRIVKRRVKQAKVTSFRTIPGKLKKTPPICYCVVCRWARNNRDSRRAD